MMTTTRRTTERHEPTRSARWTVAVATSVLPRGSCRARYRQEFLAELHVLAPPDQGHFAAGILSTAWTLRRALRKDPVMHDVKLSKPWRCRFGHHRWKTASADDGALFRRCARCGKDHPGASSGGMDYIHGGGF